MFPFRLIQCVYVFRALIISAVLSIAPVSWAQGTDGTLPERITNARLCVYADMLNLSPQQRQALEDAHKTYREKFEDLRNGPIEQWLEATRGKAINRAYV